MNSKHKMNWLYFLNNRGEVDPAAPAEGEPSALETALGEQIPSAEAPEGHLPKPKEGEEEQKADPKPKKDPKPTENLIDVQGYKGKDRRATGFSGEERRKDALEKANTLDLGFDYGPDGKLSKKISIKEVKDTFKWLQDNSKTIAAGVSLNKYSREYPDFGKVISAIVKGSFGEDNKFNADFASKVMKAVEAKEVVIEEQKDEIDAEIAKIEKILADGEIDEDSPQADALKSSMASMKAMKTQLGAALKKLDDVSKKFEGYETKQTEAEKIKTSETYKVEVKRIADLYAEELRVLTDKENKDGYKFVEGTGEAKYFDGLVRAGVSKAVADLNLKEGESITDEQFKKLVVENAKTAFAEILKKREAYDQDYIRRKGLKPPTPQKKDEKEVPEAEGDMNLEDLTKTVESMLPQE